MVLMGQRGELRVGYQCAVRFNHWSLTPDQNQLGAIESILLGRVEWIDEFWSTQSPVSIWLWMDRAWWVWHNADIRSVTLAGTVMGMVKGSPEVQAGDPWAEIDTSTRPM